MARKSSRMNKKPDNLTYSHLMSSEKMRRCRRKFESKKKKKVSDRKLKLKKKAEKAATKLRISDRLFKKKK